MTEAAPPSTLGPGARTTDAGVAAERSGPPLAGSRGGTLLLASFGAILALDWWRPLSGTLSFALLAASSGLAVPWSWLVLRAKGSDASSPAAVRPKLRARAFRLTLVLLLLGFLTAKWFVLLTASGRPEFVGSSRSYSLALAMVVALGLFSRSMHAARFMAQIADHPARLMVVSFGSAGLLGAALLSLPVSVESVATVSLVDNLFMAFSAVCVTGLAVNNVAETYSAFGQGVLCLLIQMGGLGIMVLSAAFVIMAGQKLRVKSSAVLAEMVDATSLATLRRTVLMIVVYTLCLEGIGAALLYAQFRGHPELLSLADREIAGAAVFHAVSAFCSAGLSNHAAGLVPFVGDPGVVFTVMTLIVLGGLGFPVLDELFKAAFLKLRRKRLPAFSLHSRIALRMSALLLAAMAGMYFVLEWSASMRHLGPSERLTAALLHSASTRSAGFNLVEVGAMQPAVLVLTCAAMFVGASPGSTGGGIKTTTVAVLFAGMRAELRGQTPRLLNRAVPEYVVRKAIGVAFLSLALVVVAFTVLLLIEPHPPLDLGFEVVSAFTTTGLSTGVTPRLGVPGKLLILLMMFVGRIGPLTLALAFAVSGRPRSIELPQERVLIG